MDVHTGEIADSKRRQKQILEFLVNGLGSVEQFKDEVWRSKIGSRAGGQLAVAPLEVAAPSLHPRMAVEFQKRTSAPCEALHSDDETKRRLARRCAVSSIGSQSLPMARSSW